MVTLFAGLTVWIVTKIVVESELFRPLRDTVESRIESSRRQSFSYGRVTYFDTRRTVVWHHLTYLLGCHLCTGVWVAAAVAALAPGPFTTISSPVAAYILTALTYKAIGHLVLAIEGALAR